MVYCSCNVSACLCMVILDADLLVFFFFFQAEDGIRDLYVTGVQTCALPIFCTILRLIDRTDDLVVREHWHGGGDIVALRSEERRVGKECRSRWSPYH